MVKLTLLFLLWAAPVCAQISSGQVACWALGEASGARADGIGSNNLTDSGATGNTTGKVGNAANFAGTTWLSHATNAAMRIGDNAKTIGFIFKTPNYSTIQGLVGDWDFGSDNREWLAYLDDDATAHFTVSSDGMNSDGNVAAGITLANNTVYFMLVDHDPTANEIGIQMGTGSTLGSRVTSSFSAGVYVGTGDFLVGGFVPSFRLVTGYIDEIIIWSKVLSAGERTSWFNSGNGVSCPISAGGGSVNQTLTTTGAGPE